MTNENHKQLVEDSEIVTESDFLKSNSRRTKLKRKIERSSRAGDSNSGKVNRYLKVVKIVSFAIYGLFVYKFISELNSEFMVLSIFYDAFSFGLLFFMSKVKWNGRLIFGVTSIWLNCHLIVFILNFVLVIYLQDDLALF